MADDVAVAVAVVGVVVRNGAVNDEGVVGAAGASVVAGSVNAMAAATVVVSGGTGSLFLRFVPRPPASDLAPNQGLGVSG